MTKVFFATPCYRSPYRKVMEWGVECAKKLKLKGAVGVELMNPRLEAAREVLLTNFLESDCDVILWRDDDIDVEFDVVQRMLDCPTQIVVAPYYKRIQDREVWVKQGFGLTLTRRGCLERLVYVYRELTSDELDNTGRKLHGLFDPIYIREGQKVHKKREDEAFFERARRNDFIPTYLTNVTVNHAGLISTYV